LLESYCIDDDILNVYTVAMTAVLSFLGKFYMYVKDVPCLSVQTWPPVRWTFLETLEQFDKMLFICQQDVNQDCVGESRSL